MEKNLDYKKIVSNRKLFNETVYTKLTEATKILEERQKDLELVKKIEKFLNNNIPEPIKNMGKNGLQFRDVATPNHDTYWFIELTKDHGLKTIFFEYPGDKFTSNNDFKCSLGKLHIHDRLNKKRNQIEENITIVDFNKYNGKPLKDVLTFWGEPVVNFHRRLFDVYGYKKEDFYFYDNSGWLKANGETAIKYYTNLLMLLVCHGILFENFLLTGREGKFTEEVFLPAFQNVINLTGRKPLIVPIPPMDNEEDSHWISYKSNIKKLIPEY